MNDNRVLKIKLFQPEGLYSMYYCFSRKLTYPIPYHSMIVGMICNILGVDICKTYTEKEDIPEDIIDGISIGIYGNFESLVREYVWLRSLGVKKHKLRFATTSNRYIHGEPESIGGQVPEYLNTVFNNEIVIYVAHKNPKALQAIYNAFLDPINRKDVLHLGRGEDWIVIEEVKMVENLITQKVHTLYFNAWIPDYTSLDKRFLLEDESIYLNFFKETKGIPHTLPFRFIANSKMTKRTPYQIVSAKLFGSNGRILPMRFYVDQEENIPLLLAYPQTIAVSFELLNQENLLITENEIKSEDEESVPLEDTVTKEQSPKQIENQEKNQGKTSKDQVEQISLF